METQDIDANDFNALRKLAAGVVDGLLAGRVPPYIDRDELIGECIAQLPSLLAEYEGRNGASLATFLKRAWRNDALNVIDKERRRRNYLVDDPVRSTNAAGADDDIGSPEDRQAFEDNERDRQWHKQQDYKGQLREDVFARARRLLTPEQFEALMCCYREGMTERLAGEAIGTTREAVASRLRKAIRKLQDDFRENPLEPDRGRYQP
jgi:RNA polymerase sigma factor (sigma-70 family)